MIAKKLHASLFTLAVGFAMVLLLWQEDVARNAARDALLLSAGTVIPALFPFMVLSGIAVSRDVFTSCSRFLPLHKPARLPPDAASVILLGFIGGAPVGAVAACRLYEKGRLSRRDAVRLCSLVSNPSPPFFFSTVAVWWGAPLFGIFLWITSFLIGLLLCRWLPSQGDTPPPSPLPSVREEPLESLSGSFCRSVSDAASTCLIIAAYTVFFRTSAAVLASFFPALSVPLSMVFEFTSGAVSGAGMGGMLGGAVTGFSLGFLGLSVFMQICAAAAPVGLPTARIFVTRLLHGILLGTAASLFCRFYSMSPAVPTGMPWQEKPLAFPIGLLIFLFFTAVLLSEKKKSL